MIQAHCQHATVARITNTNICVMCMPDDTELSDQEKLRLLIKAALLVDTPMHRELTREQWAEERSRNVVTAINDSFDYMRKVIR